MSEYIVDLSNSSYRSTSGLLCAGVSQLREEIVRCRDCVRFDTETEKWCDFRHELLGRQWRTAEPNGFCAWGERKVSEPVEVWNKWSADDVTCWKESGE